MPVEHRPSLPPFLSVPVHMFLLLDVSIYLVPGFDPLLMGAAALPPLVVLAFLLFLDRVEPEPAEGRWHALLWGRFVVSFVASEVNMRLLRARRGHRGLPHPRGRDACGRSPRALPQSA